MKIIINYTLLLCFTLLTMTGCEKKETRVRKAYLISSTPKGAVIYVNGKEIEQATPATIFLDDTPLYVELRKKGYETTYGSFNDTTSMNLKLEKATGSVHIASTPQGATVFINNKEVGTTPLILDNQPLGPQKATLKREGFSTEEISWQIINARPFSITKQLEATTGIVNISTLPSEATVSINGKAYGLTPKVLNLDGGTYKLVFKKDGYADVQKTITVERGVKLPVTATLQVLPATLTINSEPIGSSVVINNVDRGITPLTINNLEPGAYKISISKDGYDSEEKEIELEPAQSNELQFTLASNFGGFDILVNPPGAKITLDGKDIGYSSADNTGFFGLLYEARDIKDGAHELTVSYKGAIPESKTIPVVVERGIIITAEPVQLWFANAILTLTNGKEFKGMLVSQNEDGILFSEQKGLKQSYSNSEVKSLRLILSNE